MSKEAYKQIGDWHTQTIAHGFNQPLLVPQTVEAAQNFGLNIFCITDHYPLPPIFNDPTEEKDCSMPRDLYFGDYLQQVAKAQQDFQGKVEVRYGAEFDWLKDYSEWTRQETLSRPYDFCIGSVHFLKDPSGRYWILDYTEDIFKQMTETFGGAEKVVRTYYREVRAMAASGMFDGIGHIDLIKKYSPQESPLFDENAPWYRTEVIQTLDSIKGVGMSIEINTAGLYKKCKAQYPSSWILQEAHNRNIPLTIGSDGHMPNEIGRDLDQAVELARSVGYDRVSIYRERRRIELPV